MPFLVLVSILDVSDALLVKFEVNLGTLPSFIAPFSILYL